MSSPAAERAVVDASPLIFFTRSEHLDLLRAVASTLWVPEPVASEIAVRGPGDSTARALAQTPWLTVKAPPQSPASIVEWRLGRGESGVLSLAMENGLEALIDDLAARKCAASLGIPVRGTLGIVLTAKRRGLIPKARPVIEDMLQAGLYLAPKVLVRALERVGE